MILTIYTPTYNRSRLLERVYNHLINQTNKEFIWMIVDDGSSDDTKNVVKHWINDNIIQIKYYYKENGGVHTAREFAYDHCETELIASVDSDDWLTSDAVDKIIKSWTLRDSNNYAGIIAPASLSDGTVLNKNFPDEKCVTYQDLTFRHRFRYDKITVLKVDMVRKLEKAPSFKNEKLVVESFKWIQIPQNMPFLIIGDSILIKEYQQSGYTKSPNNNLRNNLHSYREVYRQYMNHAKYFRPLIRGYVGFIACSIVLKKSFFKDLKNPILGIIALPIGLYRARKIKK